MNTIYDNQANTYDFFPLNPKNKRKLSELSIDELKEALFDKQVRAETFSQLDEESRKIMSSEIRQNIMTMVRIKKLLKQKIVKSDVKENEPSEDLKKRIKDLNEKLKGQQNKNNELCKQIELMKQKQHEKLERVKLAKKRNDLIASYFKNVIKETYGMSAYLELISEANQRADKELSNG